MGNCTFRSKKSSLKSEMEHSKRPVRLQMTSLKSEMQMTRPQLKIPSLKSEMQMPSLELEMPVMQRLQPKPSMHTFESEMQMHTFESEMQMQRLQPEPSILFEAEMQMHTFETEMQDNILHSEEEESQEFQFDDLEETFEMQTLESTVQKESPAICSKCFLNCEDEESLGYHQLICDGIQKETKFDDMLCAEHNRKAKFYCKENECQQYLCDKCWDFHRKHTLCLIDDGCFINELQRLKTISDLKLNGVNSYIEYVANKRNLLFKEFEELENLLSKKRDSLLEFVRSTFGRESDRIALQKNNFLDQINEIDKNLKLAEKRLNQVKKYILESIISPKENSFQFCKDIEDFLNNDEDLEINFVNFESFEIRKMAFNDSDIHDVIEKQFLIFKLHYEKPKEMILAKNYSPQYYSFVSKPKLIATIPNKRRTIEEIVYDPITNQLFAIEFDNADTQIHLVSFNPNRRKLHRLDSVFTQRSSLAILSSNNILLLHNSILKCFCKLSSDVKDYSIKKINARKILFLRSVPNYQYVFIYTYDKQLVKYNSENNEYEAASLDDHLLDLAIGEDSDTLAFISSQKLSVFSFRRRSMMYELTCIETYAGITFIDLKVLVAISSVNGNSVLSILQLNDYNYKIDTCMKIVKKGECSFSFITASGFSSVYVCSKNLSKIYRIAL